MNSLPAAIREIRERLETATKLPYKEFPIIMIQHNGEGIESPQANVMNEYLKLGMLYTQEMPKLLRVVEVLSDACNEASETIHSEYCGSQHYTECQRITQALQEAERVMLGSNKSSLE